MGRIGTLQLPNAAKGQPDVRCRPNHAHIMHLESVPVKRISLRKDSGCFASKRDRVGLVPSARQWYNWC